MIDTGRLEAFSDGVIAIIITIMVLEMTVPHETDFSTLLRSSWPSCSPGSPVQSM